MNRFKRVIEIVSERKKKKEREILKEHREAQHTIHTKVTVVGGFV